MTRRSKVRTPTRFQRTLFPTALGSEGARRACDILTELKYPEAENFLDDLTQIASDYIQLRDRIGQVPGAEHRRDLIALEKPLSKVIEVLTDSGKSRALNMLHSYLVHRLDQDDRRGARPIAEVVERLEAISKALSDIEQPKGEPGRPENEPVNRLVRSLIQLWEEKLSVRIKRSRESANEEYVQERLNDLLAVTKAIDPSITRSNFDSALSNSWAVPLRVGQENLKNRQS